MAQKTLAAVGLMAFVTAVLVSWGTNRWVYTRTFDPVDMGVLLEPGQIRSGEFEINLRETYWVNIHIDYRIDDYYDDGRCSFRNLGAKHWRIFRIGPGSSMGRELWARSYDLGKGQNADGFRGIPGRYEVEWDVPAGAACLNPRHPRLQVSAFSEKYLNFAALAQYPCLILGGSGAMLALRALWSWLLAFAPKQQLRMFPELVLRSVTALPSSHAPAPIVDMSNFGVVWGGILFVLMSMFAVNTPIPSYGVLINVNQAGLAPSKASPWTRTASVYIRRLQFYVNETPIDRDKLRSKLLEALSKQMVWSVYLEADSDSNFGDAVYAMDTIRGVGAKVVWITPKMREALTKKEGY
jgi:biopolymer transport protein ExbD